MSKVTYYISKVEIRSQSISYNPGLNEELIKTTDIYSGKVERRTAPVYHLSITETCEDDKDRPPYTWYIIGNHYLPMLFKYYWYSLQAGNRYKR